MKKPMSDLPMEIPDSYVAPYVPLSPAREYYLYDHLRQYCTSERKKDELAPQPSVDRPIAEEARKFHVDRSSLTTMENETVTSGLRINMQDGQLVAGHSATFQSEASPIEAGHVEMDQPDDQSNSIEPETDLSGPESDTEILATVEHVEEMEIDYSESDERKLSISASRCGICEPCKLYIEYQTGVRSKKNAGVPRKQRLKCGKCKPCREKARQKRCCTNVECLKLNRKK